MLLEALNGSDQSMAEFMRAEEALEAELRQKSSKSRISQGISKSTVPLDEALEAVRGGINEYGEVSARDRLLRKKGSSVASSISYSTEELIKTVPQSHPIERNHDYELANVWANMLQTADLKSTLEAKINALSNQLTEIKNAQTYK